MPALYSFLYYNSISYYNVQPRIFSDASAIFKTSWRKQNVGKTGGYKRAPICSCPEHFGSYLNTRFRFLKYSFSLAFERNTFELLEIDENSAIVYTYNIAIELNLQQILLKRLDKYNIVTAPRTLY